MQITLNNGTVLTPFVAMGASKLVQGATRDTISFVFPEETDLNEMDALFTPENCETIVVSGEDGCYLCNGYTIRAELKRVPVEVIPATETEAAVYENRVIVSMGQRTYLETQIASLTDTVDVLVLDSLT
jgi:hypothetical protein